MCRHRSQVSARLILALLALAGLSLSGTSFADKPFLDRFDTVNQLASTVPKNGDVNPYGVAVVPKSVGILKRGSILVSNFNNDVNPPGGQQGTGTTIVQISPGGSVSLFAQIDPKSVACSGVGLTTALVVLRRGWVIVGSLPTTDGTSPTMTKGCLIVLNSQGHVVETFQGGGIAGPWDMTALDQDDQAWLFVTNVLNGDVAGCPIICTPPIDEGTVLRIPLQVPKQGHGMPTAGPMTVIGSGFPESADPAALVVGPTGVGLGKDGTLYVADTLHNQIVAIPNALKRQTTAGTGVTVTMNGGLMNPLGLAIAPNGHIITANAQDGNLVETTPGGQQVAVKTVDANGAGSLFGLAIVPDGEGVYFVDDGGNFLMVLESSEDQNENDDDQGDD